MMSSSSSFVTLGLSHKQCLVSLQTILDRLYSPTETHVDELELEARVTLSHEEFSALLKCAPCRSDFNHKILDVYFHAPGDRLLRARVTGDACIRKVAEDIAALPSSNPVLVSKNRIAQMELANGIRVVLSREERVEWSPEITHAAMQGRKAFRMKHVFSYVTAQGKARVDMVIVKSSSASPGTSFCSHSDLQSSGILSSEERYECEIELVVPSETPPIHDATTFMNVVSGVLVNKLSQDERALLVYLQSTHPNADVTPTLEEAKQTPNKFHMVAQPTALKRHHMQDTCHVDINAPRIYKDEYTVTVKVDGQRCFLVGDNRGVLYVLDTNLKVMPLALPDCPFAAGLVCDGEYMEIDNTLYLFDVYFHNILGTVENCMRLRFFDPLNVCDKTTRYGILKAYGEKIHGACTRVRVKEFWHCTRDNVFRQALPAMHMTKSDGLVFTPCKLPVDMLWSRVLKWKPMHTVDFKVMHDSKEDASYMYVGGMEDVSLMDQTIARFSNKPKYTHVLFPGPTSKVVPSMKMDGVPHNSVVECMWDTEKGKWVAIKVRKDKTRYDPNSRTRICRPNDIRTAMDTWDCIQEALTEKELVEQGERHCSKESTNSKDTYYASGQDRSHLAISNMLRFHNDGVKNKHLIERQVTEYGVSSVLDLACGRGGDIFKWLKKPPCPKLYVGVDVCKWNFCDPMTGACMRACKLSPKQRKRVYFLCCDIGSFELGPDCGQDEESASISRHLWGKSRLPELRNDFGACLEKFDVVSCQFALHYFFQNEMVFRTFVDNVVGHMKPGGRFVGTCLDGDAVHAMLKTVEMDGCIDGRSTVYPAHYLWRIKKKYRNEDAIMGRRIEVFLESTAQGIDEFLVDFEYLVYELYERGVDLVDTNMFGAVHDETMYPLSEPEKTLSFANRYFVFVKNR